MKTLQRLSLPALFLAGAAVFLAGLWTWWPPAALMVGGALCMAIAWDLAGREARGGVK